VSLQWQQFALRATPPLPAGSSIERQRGRSHCGFSGLAGPGAWGGGITRRHWKRGGGGGREGTFGGEVEPEHGEGEEEELGKGLAIAQEKGEHHWGEPHEEWLGAGGFGGLVLVLVLVLLVAGVVSRVGAIVVLMKR